MFGVYPRKACDHLVAVGSEGDVGVDLLAPCAQCQHIGENMLCLSCFKVHCGRHVQQHALTHFHEKHHPLVMGLADLSFWCYACEDYISSSNQILYPFYSAAHLARFSCVPPPPASNDDDACSSSMPPPPKPTIPDHALIECGEAMSVIEWQSSDPFVHVPLHIKHSLLAACLPVTVADRAIGAIVGGVVGDGLEATHSTTGEITVNFNSWRAHGNIILSVIDSLVCFGEVNGADIHKRINTTCFASKDTSFKELCEESNPLGLAINGPLAVRFRENMTVALDQNLLPRESVLAEVSAFLLHFVVHCFHFEETVAPRQALEQLIANFLASKSEMVGQHTSSPSQIVRGVLLCESVNWKSESLGNSVALGGCVDVLAASLHSLYHSTNYCSAVTRAMSTGKSSIGSVTGMMAGAFFGYTKIPPEKISALNELDKGNTALRAALLFLTTSV